MATPAMKTRLKGSRGFETIEDAQDVVALLNLMQGICCRSDDQIHPGWAVVQAKKRIYLYVQNYKTTNDKYGEDFEAYVKVVETYGGTFVEPIMLEIELAKMGVDPANENSSRADAAAEDELLEAERLARKKALGLLVLSNANKGRYKEITTKLHNNIMMGVDKYPKSVEEAVRLLNNYRTCQPAPPRNDDGGTENKEDVAFMEKGAPGGAGGAAGKGDRNSNKQTNKIGGEGTRTTTRETAPAGTAATPLT